MAERRNTTFEEGAALRRILEGTASCTGEDFFRALVENLANVMGVYAAFLTDYFPEREAARAVAFWTRDGWIEEYDYAIAGTPCEKVFKCDSFFHYPDRVPELFPDDLDFAEMGIVAYMGEPLRGIDGRVIGHLGVIDTKPLPEESRCMALFKIFAARAATERKRIDAETSLREREENLARLFEGAMDAIIELDRDLRITQSNAAASDILGGGKPLATGSPFVESIAPPARSAFARLAADLARDGSGRRSAWIRDSFRLRRPDGSDFPAEATVSCSRADCGDPFYSVVLRDVEARNRAAAKIQSLATEAKLLRAEVATLRGAGSQCLVGESPAIRRIIGDIARVATADSSVLVIGETGTGKELVAQAIHAASPRADQPLVTVNCAAVPANLIESEFFGHEKGAFTGATARREGRFLLADRGTIFLDEIGELPVELQPKLLRVLQEGTFEPVGGSRTVKVDVRVIAATNRDLESEIRENRFREDLYYRLNVFPIHVPPLRDRGDDVVLLAETLGARLAARMGKSLPTLSDRSKDLLRSYPWPGNVRELQNVVERALITTGTTDQLDIAAALPTTATGTPAPARPGDGTTSSTDILTDADLRALERDNMIRALELASWKIAGDSGAATLLGLSPSTLTSRIKAFGIKRPGSGPTS